MSTDSFAASLWFKLSDLASGCDGASYARGLSLYRTQKVLSLQIAPLKGGWWQVSGEVQGSQRLPYELGIDVRLGPRGALLEWLSDCSCPVGSQCKHGVALMIKAGYQGLRLLGESARPAAAAMTPQELEAARQAELARVQERARLEAEAQLMRWLIELEHSAKGAPEAQPMRGLARYYYKQPAVERVEQFLYQIELHSPGPVLQVELQTSYIKTNGAWAKPKSLKYPPEQGLPAFEQASETDLELLQLMRAMPPTANTYYSSYGYQCKAKPEGKLGLLMLEKAAGTGRLLGNDGLAAAAIQWGEPMELGWAWHEISDAKLGHSAWALRPKFANSEAAQLCLNKPMLYFDPIRRQCGEVLTQGLSAAQVAALLKAPALQAEALKKHQEALTQWLGAVPLPPVLGVIETLPSVRPTAHLHLRPVAESELATGGLLVANLQFDYAGQRGNWHGQAATALVEVQGKRLRMPRDLMAENAAFAALRQLGLGPSAIELGSYGLDGRQSQQPWLDWAEADFAPLREAGFELTLDERLNDWISRAEGLDVQMRPSGGEPDDEEQAAATSPWFDLSLGMEIDGARHNILPMLPALIAALAGSPLDPVTGAPDIPAHVYLPRPPPQTGFIRLPTEALKPWLAALLELVGDFGGESLKISRLDALRTVAGLGEGAVWAGLGSLRELVQRLSGRAELPEVAVPATVRASLRPYQRQGLNWLQFLREHGLAGILADDMGLGKTLQTLSHIQIEKDAGRLTRPALIIAPVSLMGNWRRESERFCPDLRCLVIHGKDRHEVAGSMAEHDIVIAPYSLLQRDKQRWLEAQWHLVVLDEAQNIKNASTHAAQVVGQLQTRHRLCLSGTPMENHLGEIWSLFHFLMPGFLGSQKRFGELFRTPIEKQGDSERLQQLRARITPFMLRRTKALVATELPPKVETIERVELEGKQADLYETIRLGMEKTVREALSAKGLAKSQITILDALLKLRQVCCDPRLLKLAAAQKVKTSAKLEQLMTLLPEMVAEGRRILLFSQFTSMLTLIEAELKKFDIAWVKLTGQSQNREALIEQFTSGAVPVFLISLKAGGVGLNLPQADTVIHYDPWWNPAVENQATDRAHRIGQTHTVFVYKLVAQGTIEERILALQERKAALADSMYSGSTGRKQPLFTESDLAELLKPLSRS
ncbi:DEAD/DEAH box helicase [Roseateles oligotrophus]|uniref:DEAD/DEAH box helicase n=1 Tax=Roseateles oligotrophus TaxID=1769250 RepID=A0ABT2YEJ0_9BURK|nr:DEAD/DEAH box helicase [Roseateles oligotrophus]MCV2368439.1 DEAD/DEAH box helicase [Roseateles oligotrophus]